MRGPARRVLRTFWKLKKGGLMAAAERRLAGRCWLPQIPCLRRSELSRGSVATTLAKANRAFYSYNRS